MAESWEALLRQLGYRVEDGRAWRDQGAALLQQHLTQRATQRRVGTPGEPQDLPPAPKATDLAYARHLISGEPIVAFILPYPPSVNHGYYIPVRRGKQILGQAARDYFAAVASAVLQQWPGQPILTGRLAALLETHAPDRRVRDLDDIEKAIFDALQHAVVYLNDGQIDDHRHLRCSQHQPPYVRVTLACCQEVSIPEP